MLIYTLNLDLCQITITVVTIYETQFMPHTLANSIFKVFEPS